MSPSLRPDFPPPVPTGPAPVRVAAAVARTTSVGLIVALAGLASLATAGTLRIPDEGTADIGSSVKEMASVAAGRYVAVVEGGSDSLYVIDTVSRDQTAVAACGSSTITAIAGDGTERMYVGCADGTLSAWDIDANGATQVADPLELGDGDVSALAVHQDQLFAFIQEDAGNTAWVSLDIDAAPAVSNNSDNRIQSAGAVRRAVSGTTGLGVTTANGVERLSPTGTLVTGTAVGFDDIVPAGTGFIVVGDDGALYQYNATAATGLFALSPSGVSANASAMGILGDELVVGTTDQRLRYFEVSSAGVPTSASATLSPPAAAAFGDPVDIVEGEGVSVAGTTQGFLWYITDGPWVEVEDPEDAISGQTGTEFDLTFQSDSAGTARVRLNGTSDTSGVDISGPIEVAAGEPVTLSYAMDGDFVEGANELRVVVTDADGDLGRDILTVARDDPPETVTFVPISEYNREDPRVARGNQSLRFVFRTLDAPDITKYVVFYSDEEFSADDYVDCEDVTHCGPKFSPSTGPQSPLVISEWSGSTHEVELSPLKNGQRYWIAVRAYDEGGKEGSMSAILTGKPEPGLGPAELAGEQGGLQCATTAGAGALGILGGLFAAVGRRRRKSGLARGLSLGLAVGLGGALALGGPAEAKDPDADDTRKGHVQFRYGIFQVDDPNITRVMGDSGNEVLWLEIGPHIIPQVEVSAGVGWFQEIGNPILAGGGRSDDNVMLTALPVNASLNLRGDFWKHQPIVPSVGASLEAWNWRQEPYGGTSRIGGVKTGWSWNAGVQLLLDRIDKESASKLRVRTGIDDTYLTLTYREQTIGDANQGLVYSGKVFGIGLKLDY